MKKIIFILILLTCYFYNPFLCYSEPMDEKPERPYTDIITMDIR